MIVRTKIQIIGNEINSSTQSKGKGKKTEISAIVPDVSDMVATYATNISSIVLDDSDMVATRDGL